MHFAPHFHFYPISILPHFHYFILRVFDLRFRLLYPPPASGFKCAKLRAFFLAHFESCVRVWDKGVMVAGSSPTCGVLAQMCEGVISLRVMHLHGRQRLIFPLMGLNMGRFPHTCRKINHPANQSVRTEKSAPYHAEFAGHVSGIHWGAPSWA